MEKVLVQLDQPPEGATWVYPDAFTGDDRSGWYYKYAAIECYHGPYATRDEAAAAAALS